MEPSNTKYKVKRNVEIQLKYKKLKARHFVYYQLYSDIKFSHLIYNELSLNDGSNQKLKYNFVDSLIEVHNIHRKTVGRLINVLLV